MGSKVLEGDGDMSNSDIRKQLGGMPTGENKLAGKTFRVIHHKPAKPAVVRMIRIGVLK